VSLTRAEVDLATAAEQHEPILDALQSGDGAQAGALLAQHAGDYGVRVDERLTATRG
jgi:DNA-binding GntR family transcriptional regulator